VAEIGGALVVLGRDLHIDILGTGLGWQSIWIWSGLGLCVVCGRFGGVIAKSFVPPTVRLVFQDNEVWVLSETKNRHICASSLSLGTEALVTCGVQWPALKT